MSAAPSQPASTGPRFYGQLFFPPARTCGTIPGELTTLDSACSGQTVHVLSILCGAGESTALLKAGDEVICRGRTADWLIIELPGRGELAVHRRDAAYVQIERGMRR
jgi:hypothetical protein